MPGHTGLTFRSDYFGDPAAFRALADLLEETFGIDITILHRFGGPDPSSMAFAWFDDTGACIANISAFALPLVIDGVPVRAAGLQSGAVRPSHRGRGLYRDVMQKALVHCGAEGFEAVALLTDTPDLYRRYGFRSLVQHRFSGAAPRDGHASAARRLNINVKRDAEMISQLIDNRAPVSDRFAPLRQREMFLFNAALTADMNIDLLEKHGAVVAWRAGEDGSCELLDVVGPNLPSLADILASLAISPSRVRVHFSPDRLAWDGVAEPDDDGMALMLRSVKELVPQKPFALSPMAEF